MGYKEMSRQRVLEILDKYKKDKDLFNWCQEYNEFVEDCVSFNVSTEWEYMLKKSYGDSESPVNYEDLGRSFDLDGFVEWAINNVPDEVKTWLIDNGHSPNETLKSLDKDVLRDMASQLDEDEEFLRDTEVYEWWIIQDPLKYRLEQEGEIFLNGAWGRQTTGQSIKLDFVVLKSFINLITDRIA